MNKIKILLITIVLILLAVGVLYGVRTSVQNETQSETEIEEVINSGVPFSETNQSENNEIIKNSWIWEFTIIGDPDRPDEIIYPNKPNIFTLKFYADKTLSGTTDCNNFGGTYLIDEMGQINIGPLMSTLMYCEGSQEQEFLESIQGGKITNYNDSFQLYGQSKKTVYFVKGEEILEQ